jgi:D-glycero-D-manno-heptose 1,7-bisphosphate phosphatase
VVKQRRAVFLDRDGVLNEAIVRDGKPYAPRSLDGFKLLPGVKEALQALREAGFLTIVVTNQPDVAAGTAKRQDIDAIHRELLQKLPLDAIKVCFHSDAEHCACRKPKPGLLVEAASEHGIDIPASYLVGDRWRDVEAAHAAGCTALFVDYRYSEKRPQPPYLEVKSLPEAATLILRSNK